jgi:transcriptional regulator of arginine metabolism
MPRSTERERSRRRHRLLELLGGGLAATQEEIVRTLGAEGFRVAQATVSRDLEELGAVRVRHGDRVVYALPERNGPPAGFGRRMLTELLVDLQASGNLVVVKTYPGMAPTVGAVIDGSEVSGVLGTVAGDDTVLVVADERTGGRRLADRLRSMTQPAEDAS